MNQNRVLTFLKSQSATLSVLGLALIAQMPHAADVFRLIVHGAGASATAHSYTFAIALELAVLLFVVQNRRAESYGFAAVSVAMNLSYYYLHGVHLFTAAAIPALLVSVSLPAAIARYSHAVVGDHADAVQPPAQKIKRTVRTTCTDEQSAEYTIVQPVQIEANTDAAPLAIVEQSETDWRTATNAQKREYVAELFRTGIANKSALAEEIDVRYATLLGWIRKLETA